MMELNYERIKNDCVSTVARAQVEVHSEVATADRGGVGKLLSVNTDVTGVSVEAVSGEARVTGKVTYKVIYLDREGKLNGLDYFGDFDETLRDERITPAAAWADAGILDAVCRPVEDTLRFEAVCDLAVWQILSHEVQALVGAEGECLCVDSTATTLQPLPPMAIEVVEEVACGCCVDRVLLFDAKAVCTQVTAGEQTTVQGVLYADVVYLCEGVVRSQAIRVPFVEELDVASPCDLTVAIKSSRLVLTGEDDNTVLRLEVVLGVTGCAMQTHDYTLVQDVFCPDVCTRPVVDALACRTSAGVYSQTCHLTAPLALADYRRPVAAVTSRVNLASLVPEKDAFTAEGLAVVGLLYEDADGRLQAGQVEIPFSQRMDAEGLDADTLLEGRVMGMQTTVGPEGVQAQVLVVAKAYRAQALRYVVDVDQSPDEGHAAVASVYFAAPDDTVWDVAHAVRVAPSRLLALNPDLAQPAGGPRRVLVFRHRDLD